MPYFREEDKKTRDNSWSDEAHAVLVLASAIVLGLDVLGLRQCTRRVLMFFDGEAAVKEALRRGELTELHDAFEVETMKAELYDLVSHTRNGRLTVSPDGSRDTDDQPCSGCQRIMVLHHQLREAETKEGSGT